MKRFRVLTAVLCAAVLLCGFGVPAYAYAGGEGEDYGDPTMETPAPEPTITPGEGFSEEGNLVTRDLLYDEHTNKQFITVQTSGGNTFYIVIDYDKPVDEEAEMYETYFLNLVDERDLLALMSDEEKEAVPTPTPEIIYVTPEPTAAPVITPQPTQAPAQPTTDKTTALLALFAIVGIGVVGAVIFLKGRNQPTARHADSELDLDDDDEDESTEQK